MATLWNSAWFHNFAPLRKKKAPLAQKVYDSYLCKAKEK